MSSRVLFLCDQQSKNKDIPFPVVEKAANSHIEEAAKQRLFGVLL